MALAAVVVCHNQPDSKLTETLAVISQQKNIRLFVATRKPVPNHEGEQLLVKADTFESVLSEVLPQLAEFEWVWALSDYQIPAPNALAELLKVTETSGSVAVIAPKLMNPQHPELIANYGLTLTPRYSLHQLVVDELDQAQHDGKQDALGVSLEGALFSPAKLVEAGGFSTALDSLAADLELGIRLRLRGLRVLLAPNAKVVGTDPSRTSLRTADLELKLFYFQPLASLVFWLLLPLLVIFEALWLMFKKQPERVLGELEAGFKVFFTVAKVWLARRELKTAERRNLQSLKTLFATKLQVQNRRAVDYFSESTETSAMSRTFEPAPKFFASGAGWVAAAAAIASWQFFPLGIDVTGGGLLPLGDNWLTLFTATGSGFQNLGLGFYAPSEPFNWLLLSLGSITFWSPGLSIVVLLFLAKALAFATAFKTVTLVTNRVWVAIIAALGYAYWPSFANSLTEGRLPQVIAHIMLPVLAFALAKVVGVKVTGATKQVTWSYTAMAALAAAVVSIAAPSITVLLCLAWLALLVLRIRKVGYLVWIPTVAAVLWLPTIWYRLIGLQKPMSLLADPSIPQNSKVVGALWLLTSENLVATIAIAAICVIGITALFTTRARVAFLLWLASLISLAGAWVFQQVKFVGNPVVGQTGDTWVNGSPQPWLSVTALALLTLLAVALDEIRWRRAAGILAFPAAAALALLATSQVSALQFTDGRVVPALIRAEAKQGSTLKTLVLKQEAGQRYSATLISGEGIHLADLNTSYRFALASQKLDSIAALAADLVSANPVDVGQKMQSLKVGYVLVPEAEKSRDLISSIDSVIGLKSIGQTEFGQLWRVTNLTEVPTEATKSQDLWSITKGLQLTVLVLFALLAIPSRRREFSAAQAEDGIDTFAVEEGEVDE